MTADLVAWLTQVWDEQEKAAREATEGPWEAEASSCINRLPGGKADEWVAWYIRSPADDGENGWSMVAAVERDARDQKLWGGIWNPADAAFIAANDPASVLARIAADRQILALHQPLRLDFDPITGCSTCSHRNDWEELQVPYPCPTVRLLAQPQADRPGFEEAWRVTP